MFSFVFNKKRLQETQKAFGTEKTITLYNEFKKHISAQLKKAYKLKDKEELRAIFHSLRSSALVFGMTKLAKLSAVLEQRILDNNELLAKDFDNCTMVYNQSIAKVDIYLRTR